MLREPALEQPASAAALQLAAGFPHHLPLAPSFPPPPTTPVTPAVVIGHYDAATGSNIPVLVKHVEPPQPAMTMSQSSAPLPPAHAEPSQPAMTMLQSPAPLSPAPAPLAPLEVPVHADIDEIPLTPAPSLVPEVPFISQNDW